jgi:hypothetical protein
VLHVCLIRHGGYFPFGFSFTFPDVDVVYTAVGFVLNIQNNVVTFFTE